MNEPQIYSSVTWTARTKCLILNFSFFLFVHFLFLLPLVSGNCVHSISSQNLQSFLNYYSFSGHCTILHYLFVQQVRSCCCLCHRNVPQNLEAVKMLKLLSRLLAEEMTIRKSILFLIHLISGRIRIF